MVAVRRSAAALAVGLPSIASASYSALLLTENTVSVSIAAMSNANGARSAPLVRVFPGRHPVVLQLAPNPNNRAAMSTHAFRVSREAFGWIAPAAA